MKLSGIIVVALKAIVMLNGKALIIKRSPYDEVHAGTWEFPGGKLDFGEELESALRREIKEETGLKVTVDKILYAATFMSSENRQVVIISYLCTAFDDEVTLSDEHTDHLWAGKTQMSELLPDGIKNDLEANNVWDVIDVLD